MIFLAANKHFDFRTVVRNVYRNSTAMHQPQTARKSKGQKMCSLVIVECALGLRGAREWCVKGNW